MLEISTS